MAWQSRVRDMERAYEQSTTSIATARRRGATKSRDIGRGLQKDYVNMLRDDVESASGDRAKTFATNGVSSSTAADADSGTPSKDPELKVRDGDGGASVGDESARSGREDVPGLDDFGPVAVDDDEEPVLTRLKPNEDVRRPSLLLRALDFSRRVGLIGASILFGIFLVFVAMSVYEEMQTSGNHDPLRPKFAPGVAVTVDERTVAEEASARGESAKNAFLDVEREAGVDGASAMNT